MKNNATRTIRSEEITIDVRICATLAANRGGEVYLAAIAPNMELTVITLDEAPGILPCFEEDDACLNLPNTSLLLCYNPAQVLKMGGKHYLTGPVILARHPCWCEPESPDWPGDSGSHQHGWRGHLADHR